MKNNLFRKSLSITIITLFLIIYLMPVMANETIYENKNDGIILEYSTIDLHGSSNIEKISLTENELVNVLESYLNTNDYPILSRILSNLFNFDFIGKRKLVVSQGIGPNFNPFKDGKTAVVKPFTTWLYSDSNNMLPLPSATGVLSINPFKIKTFMGPQFGFMLRFRGIYINIGQSSSMQSYTFFIGTARHIGGVEFTPISSIF